MLFRAYLYRSGGSESKKHHAEQGFGAEADELPAEVIVFGLGRYGRDQSLVLVRALRRHDFNGGIALTAHTAAEKNVFVEDGAHLVLRPFRDAAKEAADLLQTRIQAGGD
jgi:hypothetical protein